MTTIPEEVRVAQVRSLDDLPRFSPWPARLLGLSPWQPRPKTAENVRQEFEQEKWGPLLARVAGRQPTPDLAEVERELLGATPCLSLRSGTLVESTLLDAQHAYRALAAEVLARHWPAPALVELGCGYGSVLLDVARRAPFTGAALHGGEFTSSGRELTRLLGQAQGTPVTVGTCDFALPEVTDLVVPEGALIFTSYATPYVRELADSFVDALLARRPRAVVHLEPLYEHCGEGLLGLMQRRYIELNDYNRNLLTLLRRREELGHLTLVEETRQVFGTNALLPVSVVVWRPGR
jgi:hypothetical protein